MPHHLLQSHSCQKAKQKRQIDVCFASLSSFAVIGASILVLTLIYNGLLRSTRNACFIANASSELHVCPEQDGAGQSCSVSQWECQRASYNILLKASKPLWTKKDLSTLWGDRQIDTADLCTKSAQSGFKTALTKSLFQLIFNLCGSSLIFTFKISVNVSVCC